MTSVNPVDRPAHIATLINGVDRYNPSNCHLLEEYLEQQLSTDSYDLMANLALLKLYQFNPSLCSPVPALRALLLPLAHNPFQADFNLCWSLLSDSFVAGAVPVPSHQPDSDDDDDEDETAAAVGRNRSFVVEKLTAERLRSLSQLLASRKFVAFWQLLRQGTATQARDDVDATEHAQEVQDAVRKLVDEAPGFEARVRQSIAGEIEQSFRGIKRATLESFLGGSLSDSSDALVQQRGWTIKGDQVQLPQNESNSPVSVVTNEKIAIDQLSRLLGRTQA